MSLIEIKKLTYSYPTKKDSIKNITLKKDGTKFAQNLIDAINESKTGKT